MLSCGDFGSKLDAATENAAVIDVEVEFGLIFEIVSRVGLSGMRGEWASVLRREVVWVLEAVVKVIVLLWVFCNLKVVFGWRKIDWCS